MGMEKYKYIKYILMMLVLANQLAGQTIHRGVFFEDITSQLLPEIRAGKIIGTSSNGKEILLMTQIGNTVAFYLQKANGSFFKLIADDDSRLNGEKFSFTFKENLRFFSSYEFSPFGLGVKTYLQNQTSSTVESAYFIDGNSFAVEPVAVAGKTITASSLFETFPILVERASIPFVSPDGRQKFVFLSASQPPNRRERSGIYVLADKKYNLLVQAYYPRPFTIRESFGIRLDKKNRLWFVEIHYNPQSDSTEFYLTVFDRLTGEKKHVYKEGDLILGEKVDSIGYHFDNINYKCYATINSYDSEQQRFRTRVVFLDLSSYPNEIFKPLFNIPPKLTELTGEIPIYVSTLRNISDYLGIVASWESWKSLPSEFMFNLWNGKNISVLLTENDRFTDGKQIGKLSHKIDVRDYSSTTITDCEGRIFTFNSDGSVQYWLKFFIPCIQWFTQFIKTGEEIILKGKNLFVEGATVDVLVNNTVVVPLRVSSTEVVFLAPFVNSSQPSEVKVRLNVSGKLVFSNPVSIKIEGPDIPPPEISAIVNAASFDQKQPLAAGTIFSLFGKNLGTAESAKSWPLPTKLGGVKVAFCGIDSPLLVNTGPVQSDGSQFWQINGIVPINVTEPDCKVVVLAENKTSEAITVKLTSEVEKSLAIFSFTGFSEKGDRLQLPIMTNLAGQLIVPPGISIPGTSPSLFTQAHPCEVITLWTTGGGRTNPLVLDGEPAPHNPLAKLAITPIIQIYGLDAEVFFAGRAPGFAGLDQINVKVPCQATAGEQWLWFGRLTNLGKVYKIWIKE